MKVWKVEVHTYDETLVLLAATRQIALQQAVCQITGEDWAFFMAALRHDEEQHELHSEAWERRMEDPERVLEMWYGDSEGPIVEVDGESWAWGTGNENFVTIAEALVIDTLEP